MTLTPLRRALAVAAVMSLSLPLAACGGDDEPSGDPTTSASTSPSTEAEPDDDESANVLDEDQMSPALLTAEDLPAGRVTR